MHLPTFRIKCRFKISKFHYIRMKSRGFEIVVVEITFCGCVMCFEASATLPLYIDDYYFTLLWFIIYFFSFSLFWKKVALYYTMDSNDGRKRKTVLDFMCATHTGHCVYASCSDIVSTETWITSSFDLSFVRISLGQWNFMVVRMYNGSELWVIPNVLSRQREKKKFPVGNENRECDKLTQCDWSKYIFRYIYGFNLLRAVFSLSFRFRIKMTHYSNVIVFDSIEAVSVVDISQSNNIIWLL